jgi:hypothetical protein
VPSTKKVGGPAHARRALTHINASYVRSHFDAIEARVPGARGRRDRLHAGHEHRPARARPRGRLKAADIASGTACAEASRLRPTRSEDTPWRKDSKLIVQVDEIRREMGQAVQPPVRKALAMAVIENPYAGRYAENLDELIAIGEELGGLLGERCVKALGIAPGQAQSYGKAAIVGEAGELEHAAAILHPKLGAPLRKAVEKGAALVPSAKKRGGLGTAIDVPLGHKDAALCAATSTPWRRVADAPRANEIVVAVAVTDSGRPLPRIGGLQAHEIKGQDGLRWPRPTVPTLTPNHRRVPHEADATPHAHHRPGHPDRHAGLAHAADVIKIGEINSYKAQPAFLEPYKKGMELAVAEINAGGGLLGKKVELISRDDNANPGDAVRAAEELLSREKVDVLMGGFLSHIGLALTDFAKQKKCSSWPASR